MQLWSNSVLVAVLSGLLFDLVLGQGAPALPQCGSQCLQSSLIISSCEATNQTCLCLDDLYSQIVEICVLQHCTIKEQLTVKNATQTACNAPIRNRGTTLYTIAAALGTATALIVVLRLVFRRFVLLHNGSGSSCSSSSGAATALGPDDWCILATLVTGLPGTILVCQGTVPNGIGRDVWTLTFDQITLFGLLFFATEVQYFITLAMLKLTLLLFYLRIFPSEQLRRLLWATVVFDVLFGAAFAVTALLQCIPLSYFWTRWDNEHHGHCVNINALGWANAVISILLDVWMLALPLSQLRDLKLHWKQKIGVALMFFVGTFVTVVSVLRLQSLVTFVNSTNPTFDNFDVQYWSTIELNVGIMCACMPAMRQILLWLFPVLGGGGTMTKTTTTNTTTTTTTAGSGKRKRPQWRRQFNVPRSTYGDGSRQQLPKSVYRTFGDDEERGRERIQSNNTAAATRPLSLDSMTTMVPLRSMASGKIDIDDSHSGDRIVRYKSFCTDEEALVEDDRPVERTQF